MSLEYFIFCTRFVPGPAGLAKDAYGRSPAELGWFVPDAESWDRVELGGVIIDRDARIDPWHAEIASRFDITPVEMLTIRGGGGTHWEPAVFDIGHTLTDFGVGVLISSAVELVYRPMLVDAAPETKRPSQMPLAPVVDGIRKGKITERLTLRDWSRRYSFTKSLADRMAAEDRRALGEALIRAIEDSTSTEFPPLLDAIVTLGYSEGYDRILQILERRRWTDLKRRAVPRLDALRAQNRLDPENDWSQVAV